MTFYFKPGITFDRLANYRTGTSATVSAGSTVYDAGYTFGGENVTFALQSAADAGQIYNSTFEYTSITGTVSADPTTSSTVLNRDKVSYTMPITNITGTLNAGTSTVGNAIAITGTGTFFSSKLPVGNTFRQVDSYDVASNPQYVYYSSTLLISKLPITGTLTIAAQTPVAPDYRLYISGTNTRFLSDLLVTGGNTSTGVLNEIQSPILQPGQSTPLIYVDNTPMAGTFSWTSNSTSITGTNVSGIKAGSVITFIKPLSGRVYQTVTQPASTLIYADTINLSYTTAGSVPSVIENVIMYGQSNTSYTWTCPVGTTSISIVCIGAGGNGVYGAGQKHGGGGGGLGYWRNYPVTPGSSYSIVVGMPSASDGGNGGDTWFITSTLIRGGGGRGGANGRNGGTFAGTSGGNGGAGGAAFVGVNGGGGGGGGGGLGYDGGVGGSGYDSLYAAGDPAGTAPDAGADAVGGFAGGGGGAQLPNQAVPQGRGGGAYAYALAEDTATLLTYGFNYGGNVGSPGSEQASAYANELTGFGAGGAGGLGGSGLYTDSLGGPGVCYIIYDNVRASDWAGSSLANTMAVATTGDVTVFYTSLNTTVGSTTGIGRRSARMDFNLPFPVYWGSTGNSSNLTEVTSYTSLYYYSRYGFAFTSSLGNSYSPGEFALNLPALSVLPGRTSWIKNIKHQAEGASPNRQYKLYVTGTQTLGTYGNNELTEIYAPSYGSSATAYYRDSTLYNMLDNWQRNLGEGKYKYLQVTPQAFSGNSFDYGSANKNLLRQYWSGTAIGAAALTVSSTATSGSATNGYWRLALPWTVYYQGTGYTTLYVSHNSKIAFGNWIDYTSSVLLTADPIRQYYNEGAYYTSGGIVGNVQISDFQGPCICMYTNDSFSDPYDSNRLSTVYFNTSTGTFVNYVNNLGPASCQRIYYGIEGTAPYRRYRIRYEGDSSLTQTAGNSKYIWEISFFEHAGLGYNATSNWDTSVVAHRKYSAFGIANAINDPSIAIRKYSYPADLSYAPSVDHRPSVYTIFNNVVQTEPEAWDGNVYPNGVPLGNWLYSSMRNKVIVNDTSGTATTYGMADPTNDDQTAWFPVVITATHNQLDGVALTYEVTFNENSSQGVAVSAQWYSATTPGGTVQTTDEITAVDSNGNVLKSFSPGYWWWDYALERNNSPGYSTWPSYPSPQAGQLNLDYTVADPYYWRQFNPLQITAAQPAKTSSIPSTTSVLIKLATAYNSTIPTTLPGYGTFDATLPNTAQYNTWSAGNNLTSSAVYVGNGPDAGLINSPEAYISTIARFPQDGYNASTNNPNPNPTCSGNASVSYWNQSVVAGGSNTYYYTLVTSNGVFLFTYGSSATTHSRFLMSQTHYGSAVSMDLRYRVGNWVTANRVVSGNNFPDQEGYYGNNMPNPGTGEDLELWYNTSPEPQPPTAGQSPATLGWQKWSTLYAPTGTANENASTRTVYSSYPLVAHGDVTVTFNSAPVDSNYITWLIWQKSFTAQSTPDQRRSEYAITSWNIKTYNFNTSDPYFNWFGPNYTNNPKQGNIPKLKYEVTSGTVLRIPSLKNKNSPVWTDYVDYIVAENPGQHSLGQLFTSLIPVTSATTTSTPNSTYINSWYNTTSATTNFGTYFAGIQAAPAFIVETRTIDSVSTYGDGSGYIRVTAPMSSTAISYWGGIETGSAATASGTRAFALDRVYSNSSLSVVDAINPAFIGAITSTVSNVTAAADRRFTIVSVNSDTSITVSGGGIYTAFAGRTSTFPQKENTQFTISGYHDASNLTAATTWASIGVPGIADNGQVYGAEYLPTTTAFIGNSSYTIVSINSDISLTLLGTPPSKNFYDTGLTLRWNAPSSNIVITGVNTQFLPVTTAADNKIEIQVSTSSDAKLGSLYIGNQLFKVSSIINSSVLIASGPAIATPISGQTAYSYRQLQTYALARALARVGGASWDKTGTVIGVDESLVTQPVSVNFDSYRELFNNTSAALSFTANQQIVSTSITVNSVQSSVVLLITWMKDFAGNAAGESSNSLKVTVSSAGFTIVYDDETQRNYKDVALGRTLMYNELSYIGTSNAATISSTAISGATTGTAALIWYPANRLRSGTYARLTARLTNLSSTAVTITVNAGVAGWTSTIEDFLNITVIGAN
jgi:hypothetical protein